MILSLVQKIGIQTWWTYLIWIRSWCCLSHFHPITIICRAFILDFDMLLCSSIVEQFWYILACFCARHTWTIWLERTKRSKQFWDARVYELGMPFLCGRHGHWKATCRIGLLCFHCVGQATSAKLCSLCEQHRDDGQCRRGLFKELSQVLFSWT